jgi:light-regulated signal transduction histidine kinase (bacteriophytochrome)
MKSKMKPKDLKKKSTIVNAKKEELQTYISYANHEFKNPLTSIKAYLQLAQRSLKKGETKDLNKMITEADQEINKLNTIISRWSQTLRSNYNLYIPEFKVISLNTIWEDLTKEFTLNPKVINLDKDYYLEADLSLLKQAYSYLLRGILQDGTQVAHIDFKSDARSISNTISFLGIIPQEKINTAIKSPFSKGETLNDILNSRAMDIFNAAKILELHKGQLTLEKNQEGKYFFLILLPKKQ